MSYGTTNDSDSATILSDHSNGTSIPQLPTHHVEFQSNNNQNYYPSMNPIVSLSQRFEIFNPMNFPITYRPDSSPRSPNKDGKYDYHGVYRFEQLSSAERGDWIQVTRSSYGLFVSEVLKNHNYENSIFLLLQTLVSGVVQGNILIYLWLSLPSLDNSALCHGNDVGGTAAFLLISIVVVFLASLSPSFQDSARDLKIAFFSKQYLNELERASYNNYSSKKELINNWIKTTIGAENPTGVIQIAENPFKHLLAITAAIYESIICLGVCIVGVYYIITTDGVGNIIQSAIAITFINEIACFTVLLLPNLRKTQFLAVHHNVPRRSTSQFQYYDSIYDLCIIFEIIFYLFGFGPLLIILSVAVIFGLKTLC